KGLFMVHLAAYKPLRKCHVCAELRSGHAPLFNTDLRSLSNEFAHLPNRLQIMFIFLVFCSVDGWQTTTLEGLSHLWHILFTHFKPSIYLWVNKMSRNGFKRH